MKKRKTRMFLLWLTVCMLTACQKENDSKKEKESDSIKADGNAVVALIDGEELKMEEAAFYAYCQQASYEAYYLASENQEIDWSAKSNENDQTLEEQAKEEVLEIMKRRYVFLKHSQEFEVELTKEEEAEVEERVHQFMTESDKKILNACQANEDLVHRLYERNAIYEKIKEALIKDADITVTQKEAKQALCSVVEFKSDVEDREKKAEAIISMVKKGTSMEAAAKAYGYEMAKGNIGIGDMENSMLETTCLSMKTGEITSVEYEDILYIVYCDMDYDKEATKLAKEEKIEEKKQKIWDKQYEEWLKDVSYTLKEENWNQIHFKTPIFTMEDMEAIEETDTGN